MTELVQIQDEKEIQSDLELFLECFPDLMNRIGCLQKYAKKLAENATVLLLLEDETPVGFAAYYANDQVGRIAYIALIGILANYRRKGLGTYLLKYISDTIAAAGMSKIRLEVDIDNMAAIQYYKSNGFTISEKARETSYYMTKSFYCAHG